MSTPAKTLGAVNDALTVEGADRALAGQVVFQFVDASFVGTVTFEANVDLTTWVAVQATNLNTGGAATTTTAAGLFRVDASGLRQVRARVSAYTSGSLSAVANPVVG